MDINKNNIDNKKENSLAKFDIDTYMFNIEKYSPDLKDDNFYTMRSSILKGSKINLDTNIKIRPRIEDISRNLITTKIDLKQFNKSYDVHQLFLNDSDSVLHDVRKIKASDIKIRPSFKNIDLSSNAKLSSSLINHENIKPYIEKSIKATLMSNETRISEYTKDLSNSLVTSKHRSMISDSLKDVLSNVAINTKISEKIDFKIQNISENSGIRISDSINELLRAKPIKLDIDIQKFETSLDHTNVNFSKPSEMTSFILDNTDNARSLTVEEAKTIDSIAEAKDDNELIKAYDKGVKIFGGNVELLISYIILIVTILASFSNNFYAGTLFGKTIDEFLDPAFKDIHKKAKKILDPKDNETSKNDNSKE